ncbi:MAG: CDP-diacylglycerol diphosphatase [Bacteriovorax sp.]|nr:CDP-diacylglycerol diphosphatase [Bacteriovorax sp.]
MVKIYNASNPDEDISLAINSFYGRRQNQLHIHISSIQPDIKNLIHQNLESIDDIWSAFPGGILGHSYITRRISFEQFKEKNPFKLLVDDLPVEKNAN